MGTQFAVDGISRRAYAKRRSVTEAAIRKRIADGTLAKALTTDGRIDPDVADRLLAEGTTAGAGTAGGLSEARRRKTAAAVALLCDEVAAFEGSVVSRQDADIVTRRLSLMVAKRLLQIPADIAATVAGKQPAIAAGVIDDAVFTALTEISEAKIVESKTKADAAEQPSKALATMTLVELATLRADLQARRLETERKLKRREAVLVADLGSQLQKRVIILKTNVLAMHHKLAPRFQNANAAKARVILSEELNHIVECLACKAVSAEELKAALKPKPAKGKADARTARKNNP